LTRSRSTAALARIRKGCMKTMLAQDWRRASKRTTININITPLSHHRPSYCTLAEVRIMSKSCETRMILIHDAFSKTTTRLGLVQGVHMKKTRSSKRFARHQSLGNRFMSSSPVIFFRIFTLPTTYATSRTISDSQPKPRQVKSKKYF
jgi:hypothetical protein